MFIYEFLSVCTNGILHDICTAMLVAETSFSPSVSLYGIIAVFRLQFINTVLFSSSFDVFMLLQSAPFHCISLTGSGDTLILRNTLVTVHC